MGGSEGGRSGGLSRSATFRPGPCPSMDPLERHGRAVVARPLLSCLSIVPGPQGDPASCYFFTRTMALGPDPTKTVAGVMGVRAPFAPMRYCVTMLVAPAPKPLVM